MRRLAWIVTLLLAVSAAQADDARDHDRAREALEAGEVMPLPRILDRVERDYPGRVLEVELERDDGRWLYEIKLLQPDGRVLKLDVDAADARVLKVKGREHHERRDERRSR
ncbi:MAG TPA: PepSY domain-containing protein [Burkholderiales bacterium]|nr:PepSY domain-containing protein [Burkholderiales bacterium]